MNSSDRIQQVLSLLACLLIVSSLALVRQGEWLGHEFKPKAESRQAVNNDTVRTLADGTVVVSTSPLAADISGYGGKVPLEISIKDGVVVGVKALPNDETKDFFDEAATLLTRWKGKRVSEAASMQVDGVSGATFSSKAIIGNMQRGLRYAQTNPAIAGANKATDATRPTGSSTMGGALSAFDGSAKSLAGLLVVLMAAVLPLFVKNRKYHLFQLILNVIVLGFWCGMFLSYTALIGYAAHGMDVVAQIVPLVMLVTAFIYPLFGKKSYYCTHVCPFGSLQQVAGKCVKRKWRIGQKTLQRLDKFRQVLWAALMLCIWGGVWSEWTDFEPFSAFIFQSASWVTIAIAAAFVALSFVVTRPYCRFVCPMGTLLRLSQTSK